MFYLCLGKIAEISLVALQGCLFGFLVGEFQFSALRAPTLAAAPFGYNLWKTKHWGMCVFARKTETFC